jgi:hypothetical protein
VFESFSGPESTGKGGPERVLGDREHGCSVLVDGFVEEFANIPEDGPCSSSVPFWGCCHTRTINGSTRFPQTVLRVLKNTDTKKLSICKKKEGRVNPFQDWLLRTRQRAREESRKSRVSKGPELPSSFQRFNSQTPFGGW